jgi:hypothetical protein
MECEAAGWVASKHHDFGRISVLLLEALGRTIESHGSILAVSIADVDHSSSTVD